MPGKGIKGGMTPATISYEEASQNLAQVVEDCVEGGVPVIIRGQKGRVIMIPYSEWASEQETQFLLSDPEDRRYLLESIAQIKHGQVVEYKGMDWDEDSTDRKG